jgi:hypothetical protein
MNSTRFRCWIVGVKVTAVLVGLLWAVMTDVALATHHDASSFDWIVGLVGFFILGGSIFGGEKLYQKYKDR